MNQLGLEGLGTELGLINLAAVLGVIWKVMILPYIQVRYGRMIPKKKKTADTVIKKPGNPGVKPGDGDACKENRDLIIELRTEVKNIKEEIKAINRKLDKI